MSQSVCRGRKLAREDLPAAAKSAIGSQHFVDQLDEAERAELETLGRVDTYGRGSWIMRQGDPSDFVCILIEGRAKVTIDTEDGRAIVLTVLGARDVLGEFEALGEAPIRVASVVAVDEVSCRVINSETFRDYLLAHPAASLALVRAAIRRLGTADRRRVDFTSTNASHTLARFLIELIDMAGPAEKGDVEIEIPLAQHELASLIGVSRNSVVRVLSNLRTRGLLSSTKGKIRVVDAASLRRFVEEPRSTSGAAPFS